MKILRSLLCVALLACCPLSQAVELVVSGGVSLKSWEHFRGKSAHDNWWANFIRGGEVRMKMIREKDKSAPITWIIFRPAYVTRGREEGKDLFSSIRESAAKYNAKIVWVDNADQFYRAVNNAGRINSFYYFGHSNAHAWMLDYSNDIIGASCHWIHERDLAKRINRSVFAPNADCRSYGCYTGQSMSRYWKQAFGMKLIGNTESTRYQPVGDWRLPSGAGRWVN